MFAWFAVTNSTAVFVMSISGCRLTLDVEDTSPSSPIAIKGSAVSYVSASSEDKEAATDETRDAPE